MKGATAQAQTKPATLETGLVIQVPAYLESGDAVQVDTRDGRYMGRGKASARNERGKARKVQETGFLLRIRVLDWLIPTRQTPSRCARRCPLGIFAAPVEEVNYRDFDLRTPFGRRAGWLRRHFAFKQFQFLGALSETVVFGCAIAALKYVNTAFVYVYEPATRRFRESSFTDAAERRRRLRPAARNRQRVVPLRAAITSS